MTKELTRELIRQLIAEELLAEKFTDDPPGSYAISRVQGLMKGALHGLDKDDLHRYVSAFGHQSKDATSIKRLRAAWAVYEKAVKNLAKTSADIFNKTTK